MCRMTKDTFFNLWIPISAKISQAKALVRFSGYGAAQKAALEEKRI
jgi:hypothetical protein